MFRWLHDLLAQREPQDLRPRPALLRPDPPHAIKLDVDADPRLLAMFDLEDPAGIKSWAELVAWFEWRAADLRAERANLQAQLAALQSFARYKP